MTTSTRSLALLPIESGMDDAIARWQALDDGEFLAVGDDLFKLNKLTQLAVGYWLNLAADRKHGDIAALADKFDKAPGTLYQWKSVAKRIAPNLNRDSSFLSLGFGKMQQIARIPSDRQPDWIDHAKEMKRDDLAKAVSAAKKTGDWTPPAGDIIVLEPAPASPKPSSEKEVEEQQPEYRHVFGRLYWRKQKRPQD